MRKITLTLVLVAGLIAAVTTAPVPSPDPHHGGPHASDVDEEDGLKWVSEARMRKKPMNQRSMTTRNNMSRKKANMRKQESMVKKSNMNDKPKMKSNAKRRKNSNKRRQPASKSPSGQKQSERLPSFAERLQALQAQQRKEADNQRKRERDEYLAILKETGVITDDEDTIRYQAEPEEFNPFKQEQKEQQKLLKQQAVPLVPETAGQLEDDDDDDYNPFDVEEDYQYEKYTREQVEKEQRRIEAERTERIRERMRDREALKWNNSRRSKIRAQERMDTGGESDVYPGRLRFIKDLNLSARHRQRENQEKEAQKMNPLNPRFKARQKSYVAAWRSKMRI